MLKTLRFAVTGLFMAVSVLLAALWAHSFGMEDSIRGPLPGWRGGFEINSMNGRVDGYIRVGGEPWRFFVRSITEMQALLGCSNRYDYSAHVPHWCLIGVSLATAATPWLRWKFSLRTMLVVMTLVAVVLGLCVGQ